MRYTLLLACLLGVAVSSALSEARRRPWWRILDLVPIECESSSELPGIIITPKTNKRFKVTLSEYPATRPYKTWGNARVRNRKRYVVFYDNTSDMRWPLWLKISLDELGLVTKSSAVLKTKKLRKGKILRYKYENECQGPGWPD